ncbi:hypothetical protein T265_10675 [Opisthorchis viverrini]|uniref:Uncharacterized protein n=1 Tax=Opisthorchis viverrini TaxID=6198 RepID=A0A074Z1K9_OPIVI|nr:hypothetical protein T265_10675 [Opisthorchis viverrini]KER20868.1 hypothetical protein T265_10675 [Opisthorchis viverrini]
MQNRRNPLPIRLLKVLRQPTIDFSQFGAHQIIKMDRSKNRHFIEATADPQAENNYSREKFHPISCRLIRNKDK